jgi:hypothetical protein
VEFTYIVENGLLFEETDIRYKAKNSEEQDRRQRRDE